MSFQFRKVIHIIPCEVHVPHDFSLVVSHTGFLPDLNCALPGHIQDGTKQTLTHLGPRYTGAAPGHRCHCAVPPTSLLRPAGTAAARRPS